MFNDGPMDASGRWVDRPLAVLEDVQDKLELHFEKLLDKIEDDFEKAHDHVENLQDKFKHKGGLRRLTSKTNSHTKDIINDLFGWAASQPNPPSQLDQPTKVPENSEGAGEPEKAPNGSKDSAGSSAATCDPSNSHVRFEWSNYSNSDRTAFVKAIKCLQDKPSGGSRYTGSSNRYEDLISVHRGMTADIHQTAAFLVWHRYFVWVFEQLLRDECGFDRAMPWWDETNHAGAFAASDVFTTEWFGHLPAKTSDGQGTCIESGEFAGTTLHVGPGNNNENHCLSRAVDESQTAQCNKDFTNSCLSMKTYEEFRDCFELGPHGYGHNGIGAVMAEVSASVGDPVFFMHHLFVDHTFRIWQNANPSRRTTISGCADKANPCTPITLDTKLSSNGLRPDVTVGQVMNTLSGTICYRYDY
ncbi:Di-copper centre-containing protein [Xylaria acuta]|nr:Di-copper centre-containing protein [Xylaria acuta]